MKKTVSRTLLAVCIGLSAGVTLNALYLQPGGQPATAMGGAKLVDLPAASTPLGGEAKLATVKPAGKAKVVAAKGSAAAADKEANVAATVAALVLGPAAEDPEFAKAFADQQLLHAVRRELANLGYAPGNDGRLAGLETRAEILAFEADRGLPLTASPSESLLQALLLGAAGEDGDVATASNSLVAKRIISAVEQHLVDLGYSAGPVDGVANAATKAAIKAFEADRSLTASGRISADLVRAIAIEVTRRGKSS